VTAIVPKFSQYTKIIKKVKLLPHLIKNNTMMNYGGIEVYFHAFVTLGLDGSKWTASDLATSHLMKEPLIPTGPHGPQSQSGCCG
jgi:hypothetical protein